VKLSLDPRTKLFILVLINLLVFFTPSLRAERACMGIITALAFLMGAYRQALRGLGIYALMMGALRLCGLVPGFIASVLSMMVICFRKMVPIFAFASAMIATTRVGDLVSALQKMGVPRCIIIPFAITLRFFPTAREEFSCIRDAMKLRGIGLNIRNLAARPLTVLESVLVPLMLQSANLADELSAAALTRGIDREGKRSSLRVLRLGPPDWIVSLAFLGFAVFALRGGLDVPRG
jgi:energy-coupling factor transport system permease protein